MGDADGRRRQGARRKEEGKEKAVADDSTTAPTGTLPYGTLAGEEKTAS